MKALLLLVTLALGAAASAAEATKPQSVNGIAPAPDMNLYAASTPEPSHAMLLMLGLAGLAVRRRR